MPHYSYLLFDADNTLFDFDAANRNAFHTVCRQCDIPDTDETFALYERCNNAMWAAFDRGECTKDFLVVERFRRFLEAMALDRDPALCNRIHLKASGGKYASSPPRRGGLPHPVPDPPSLYRHQCRGLRPAQPPAPQRRGPLYHRRFISEDAGASKPSRAYFDYVFRPHPPVSHGRIACSSVTPPPAISGAPTTPASPAAGTTPTAPPCRRISTSTTASLT